MFEMVETHRETVPYTVSYPGQDAPGTIIFRDRARKITVRHDHTHRGGSLYGTGHVTVRNEASGLIFTYYTTCPPIDARSAAHMAWYKRDAIGYTEG